MVSSLIKSADWKAEKHVPVITLLGDFRSDEPVEIEVSVGKEVPHPNTVEHHIDWIALYCVAEGSRLPIELVRADFSVHGPDVFAEPIIRTRIKLPGSCSLHAVAYCNLHGLWEAELQIG